MSWKSFFLLLFCFILIDYVVISYNQSMWQNFISKIPTINGPNTNYDTLIYSLIAWSILVLGLSLFVVDKIKSLSDCIVYGIIYAFIVYGVFNFTNLALMKNIYTWDMAWKDILSGMITTVLSLMAFYSLNIKN
jgi:uncharacterized membrane protein